VDETVFYLFRRHFPPLFPRPPLRKACLFSPCDAPNHIGIVALRSKQGEGPTGAFQPLECPVILRPSESLPSETIRKSPDTAVCTVVDPSPWPGMLLTEKTSPTSASVPIVVWFNRTANRCRPRIEAQKVEETAPRSLISLRRGPTKQGPRRRSSPSRVVSLCNRVNRGPVFVALLYGPGRVDGCCCVLKAVHMLTG